MLAAPCEEDSVKDKENMGVSLSLGVFNELVTSSVGVEREEVGLQEQLTTVL